MSTLKHSGKANFYTQFAELPLPTSAEFISPASDVVRVSYSIRDHQRNIKSSLSKSYILANNTISPVLSQDTPDIQASIRSPSKVRTAILREVSDQGGSSKKRFVEIWSGLSLEASLEVTTAHGAFATDSFLSSLSFSPSESALLYTAESSTDSLIADDPYAKFRFTPHFGETLYTKKRPTIFLFRWRDPADSSTAPKKDTSENALKDLALSALSFTPPTDIPVLLGQAVFADENRVFVTGYEHTADGRLLGIKGCFNRPTGVYVLDVPPQPQTENVEKPALGVEVACTLTKLTSPSQSGRSPRVLYDANGTATHVFWLTNTLGGAHASTVSLHSIDLSAPLSPDAAKTLISPVQSPKADEFPGLYTEYNLPSSPFVVLGGNTYIVTQSMWHSRTVVLLIDTTTGDVRNLTPDGGSDKLFSWNVMVTDGRDRVVCSRSTPTTPSEVLVGKFDAGGNVEWLIIDKTLLSEEADKALADLEVSIIPIPEHYPTETIVIKSKSASTSTSKPTCITSPHGGPHATSTTAFTAAVTALALEGYTLSLPNYTGSLGFGEEYVTKLLGKCGSLDVEDCIATVRHLIDQGISQAGKQLIQGGSHGGFLTAHLIGQYPDLFNAAVMRNPVISCGELSISDIPDWYYAEFGLPFTPLSLIDPATYEILYRASPIVHVDNVKVPVLLLLGEDDMRVAPTQGVGYYHALKGRGKAVDILCFPKETHPIEGVEAAKVSWEAGRDWFKSVAK